MASVCSVQEWTRTHDVLFIQKTSIRKGFVSSIFWVFVKHSQILSTSRKNTDMSMPLYHSYRRSRNGVDPTPMTWGENIINYTACRVSVVPRASPSVRDYFGEKTGKREKVVATTTVQVKDVNITQITEPLFSRLIATYWLQKRMQSATTLSMYTSKPLKHRWSNDGEKSQRMGHAAKEKRSQSGRFHTAIKQSALVQWDN